MMTLISAAPGVALFLVIGITIVGYIAVRDWLIRRIVAREMAALDAKPRMTSEL